MTVEEVKQVINGDGAMSVWVRVSKISLWLRIKNVRSAKELGQDYGPEDFFECAYGSKTILVGCNHVDEFTVI